MQLIVNIFLSKISGDLPLQCQPLSRPFEITPPNVWPHDGDIFVPVEAWLLMHKAQGMHELMGNHSNTAEAAGALERHSLSSTTHTKVGPTPGLTCTHRHSIIRIISRLGGKQRLNNYWLKKHFLEFKQCIHFNSHPSNFSNKSYLKTGLLHDGVKLSKQQVSPRLLLDVDEVSLVCVGNKPHTRIFLYVLHSFLYHLCLDLSCSFV